MRAGLYHGVTAAQGAQDGGIYSGSETYYEDGYVEGALYIGPPYRLDSNSDATTWKIAVAARTWGSDGQPDGEEYLIGFGTVQVKRMARATVNASPEPVAKGKALTVTGKLTRADWVRHAYVGYGGKSDKLQFRKAGTRTYNTVKIVQAGSTASLKTTVTAAAGDYVDVT
ncbi:hypothetical protein ACIHJG_08500 [Streptomyces sp. NPDC052415]|uniref:hypothetical protein n=1 Tax=Streptomyces sp. NPDC052415 TaxID=3365690 RepID=UPI0037D34FD4